MLKILLVYDDFQELTSVELMLKKIGFDVVGITSEFSLAEQLLSFNPQIVVAQGRTAKVSTANVGRRLRESARWDGQSVLIFYSNAKPQPTELLKIRMDVGLEYPVEPTKMVQVLAQLGSLDANQLLDKLIKNMADTATAQTNKDSTTFSNRSDRDSVFVSGGTQAPETNQKFGGAAGADARKALTGAAAEAEARKTLSGSAAEAEARKALNSAAAEAEARKALGGFETEEEARKALLGEDYTDDSKNSLTGSAADAEARKALSGGGSGTSNSGVERPLTAKEAMEQLARGFATDQETQANKDVKGKAGSDSNNPLFPLNSKDSGSSASNVGGANFNPAADPNQITGKFDVNPFQLENMPQDPLMQELENLLQKKPDLSLNPPIKDPARHKKYEEYMKTIPIQHMASIKRREAKLRLRDLIKDIDKPGLQDQDVLRREYVKALFKKQG